MDDFLNRHRWSLQQVQDYIPLPMTMGAAMYYTGKDSDGNPLQVQRGLAERREQIEVLKKRRSGPGGPPPPFRHGGKPGAPPHPKAHHENSEAYHGKSGNKKKGR